jgi:two-component system response regulator YesN
MKEHYTEKIQLSDVADHVYVSHWHLSKLLNRHTGKSFSDLMNGIRVDKARELMSDPSLHIVDVAEKVGFTDMAHFSRVFRKQTGQSANEYRNTIRK